ncbi:MAG: hypothetical protein PUC58_07325 [Oscillospiraceae bacterium]|nr:hypothetical protein [Oscillospiraceae bacterium]
MKLTLKFKLPECETYDVEVGGEKKEVNSTESTAVFELGEGEYTIGIRQQADGFLLKPFASWLVFALTAVFQGIFYIVTMGLPQFDGLYGEKWWTSVRPYRLYAELAGQVSGDTEKTIDIKNPEYDTEDELWLPPSASTPDGELKTELIKNDGDFKYQYLRYARGFTSVASVGIVLFAVLFIVSLNRQITALAALFGILLAASVILTIVTLITEHNRMKKLLKKAYRES